MTRIGRQMVRFTLGFLTVLAVVSCSQDKPAVCAQADELRAAVDNVRYTTVSENGITALDGALDQVKVEFEQFRSEARNQFQPQVDAVQAAADQTRVDVTTARAEPTTATLEAVGASRDALATSVRNLRDAVGSTC
jgi:hypothetical protein